ncbi:hypothetical protein PLCT2_01471 [Planctomycetaceae bacterium]|nr:hypothetical protein PLCT2_01471 [Planctomycetaceae bacterium]
MGPLRFQPAIVVAILLASACALAVASWRAAFGIAVDESLQRALVYVELALPLIAFAPAPFKRRGEALLVPLWALACLAAGSATLFAFSFASTSHLVQQTRGLSAAAWTVSCGIASLGAALEGRFGGPWLSRARVAWLGVATLPALWHYFALEYATKSLLHLRLLSPHWLLAAFPDGAWESLSYWPLLVLGSGTWLAALILTRGRA